jgi:hypothetical protein
MLPQKYLFYLNLVFNFLTKEIFAREIKTPSSHIGKDLSLHATKKIKIYFYSRAITAGTRVVILDVIPEIIKKIKYSSLPWDVIFSSEPPKNKVDYLICFKSLPPKNIIGNPKIFLSICDEGENFWQYLKKFDALVASSSIKFAKLISLNNKETYFISESENSANINFGSKNLKNLPSKRPCNLFWHGLPSSYEMILKLKPYLIKLAEKKKFNLLVVSGKKAMHKYKWGEITISHFPWSVANMRKCAKISRLGLVPARSSLRTSYLKPASRLRCLYALGVPSIGDSSVPDVNKFNSPFSGPSARSEKEFAYKINYLLNHPKLLNKFALNGFKHVKDSYSTSISASQWINLIYDHEMNK